LEIGFCFYCPSLPILCLANMTVHATMLGFFSVEMKFYSILVCSSLEMQSSQSQPLTKLGIIGAHYCTQVLVELGVSQTFYPSWSWTTILLISASQEASITGMIQWHLGILRIWFIMSLYFWWRQVGLWKKWYCEH
jgi:hypothetical protein